MTWQEEMGSLEPEVAGESDQVDVWESIEALQAEGLYDSGASEAGASEEEEEEDEDLPSDGEYAPALAGGASPDLAEPLPEHTHGIDATSMAVAAANQAAHVAQVA